MEYSDEKIKEFKENQKTQFLASQFDSFQKKLEEAKAMVDSDPEMAELAAEEVKELEEQMNGLYEEMDRIIESSKEEEKKPYGVM